MVKPFAVAALAAPIALAFAMPAAAQDQPTDEKVNMVIIYGDDACPQSTEDQITVCARKAESERYRIPQNLRTVSGDTVAWADRAQALEMVGAFGTMSCSPAGLGGASGCTQKMIDAAYADKERGHEVRFGQLIDEARKERLSTIDADAAAEQGRVEQIEKEYMDRLDRERAAPTPGEQTNAAAEAATSPATAPQPPKS